MTRIKSQTLFTAIHVLMIVASTAKSDLCEAAHPQIVPHADSIRGYTEDVVFADPLPDHLADNSRDTLIKRFEHEEWANLLYSWWRESDTWTVGDTLTVAFEGGSRGLHQLIESTANYWTQYANITLDFGVDVATGQFRRWYKTDTTSRADIRISFDGYIPSSGKSHPGYWSAVGRAARIAYASDPTMNFQAWDIRFRNNSLPTDYSSIILHEFGHALGLRHEHQNPGGGCRDEFRLEDDAGYVVKTDSKGRYIANNGLRPGLLRVLSGAPYYWNREQIATNLLVVEERRDDDRFRDFDKYSIMKYYFDANYLKRGVNSPCFSNRNLVLSDGDKLAAAIIYPRSGSTPHELLESRTAKYGVYSLLMKKLQESGFRDPAITDLTTHIASFTDVLELQILELKTTGAP